jgi:hypothetical protein
MGDLTTRQKQVFTALGNAPLSAGQIANMADIRTRSPRETASKYADQLVRLGFAVKGGSRTFPTWTRRHALTKPDGDAA